MEAVIGVAAKSLDAAQQLARAIHGTSTWSHQQWIGLHVDDRRATEAPEVPAHALLLLSHDRRTAYLLVATHASASELLAALSASAGASAAGSPPDAVPPPAVPPLQRLQAQHDAASAALLLQLFLAADVVLALLPTGGGLTGAAAAALAGLGGGVGGWVGGGGGGALAGANDWLVRLRLLQAAKRALHQSLSRPGTELPEAGGGAAGEGEAGDGVAQLRAWCRRSQPPLLYFVSPSDVPPTAPLSSATTSAAPPSSRAASARPAPALAPSSSPRDASWLMRSLLKRCKPLPATALTPASAFAAGGASAAAAPADPWVLCSLDPQALVLEPGPLDLGPAKVQATVLAALMGPDWDSDCGLSGAAGAGGEGAGGDMEALQVMRDAVVAAAQAAAAANNERQPRRGPAGEADGVAAAQRFAARWRAAAAALYGAAAVAWREAAQKPLEWLPPALGPEPTPPRTRGSGGPTPVAPERSPLDAAAACLAGGDAAALAARLASELCTAAADAALRQYVTCTPPRYPARVHAAAVAAAVASLQAAAPPGPAVAAATARLRAACDEAWRKGRRQCSALSATGRPCSRALHVSSGAGGVCTRAAEALRLALPWATDPVEAHSCEGTLWCVATTSGCGFMQIPDSFDLRAGNAALQRLSERDQVVGLPPAPKQQGPSATVAATAAAAPAGGRSKGPKRGGGAAASASPAGTEPSTTNPGAGSAGSGASSSVAAGAAHSRHVLVVAVAQGPDGSMQQCALGPWATVTRLGPASAYSERRGLANQPGLNGSHLFPMVLPGEGGAGARGSGSAGRGRGGGGGGGARGSKAAPPAAAVLAVDAAAAAGSDSDGGVALDEQSFPSLAAAMAAAQAGKQGAAAPAATAATRGRRGGRQQPAADAAATGSAASAPAPNADAVSRERAAVASAWPFPNAKAVGGGAAPGRGRRGRGAPGGEERAAGEAEGAQVDAAGFPALPTGRDVRRVYVGYEYQTLDGRRFLATPQQLAAASAGVAAAASAAVATAASAGAPTPAGSSPAASALPQQNPPASRSGRPPRGTASAAVDAAQASAAAAAASAAAASAAAAAAGATGGSAAASFLLQHDAPLFLQPPAGVQPDPSAPPAQDTAPAWDPTPRRPGGLAQLARIFVVTPPSACGEPLLAVRPTVQFRVLQAPQLPADAAEAALRQAAPTSAAGVKAAASGDETDGEAVERSQGGADTALVKEARTEPAVMVSGQGPAASAVQVTLAGPVPLPPDSLMVVSLPLVYGLPAEWLGWCGGMPGAVTGQSGAGDEGLMTSVEEPESGAHVGDADAAAGPAEACANSGGARPPAQPLLVPLVQLDERGPFDARLVAGSALFPIAAGQS